jgi:signal transduction histidine kinase
LHRTGGLPRAAGGGPLAQVAPTICLISPVGRLPGDLVTNLFAVVGEALTNVARHARAESAGSTSR